MASHIAMYEEQRSAWEEKVAELKARMRNMRSSPQERKSASYRMYILVSLLSAGKREMIDYLTVIEEVMGFGEFDKELFQKAWEAISHATEQVTA